jgi:diguanylate cyclase (GGDEF)-like protein
MSPEPFPIILSVGADPATIRLVRSALEPSGCELAERSTAAAATTACSELCPGLVLLDAGLHDARAFLESVVASRGAPVLVLADPTTVESALTAGAWDCLSTPFQTALLARRVEIALQLTRANLEVTRLREAAGATDAERSGLSTRAAFTARLESAIENHRPERGAIAVLHIALDVSTDRARAALETSARRIKDGLRDRDTIARTTGELSGPSVAHVSDNEITVLLAALERPQETYKIARRVQELLSQPMSADGTEFRIAASLGIAIHPEDGTRATDLLEAGDRAMRAARDEGKSLIRFARPAMNALIFERLTLESHLRHALERSELMVYYQPRVSIGTGEIVSVEALLRWKHPELGMVSPAQFIPVAEESGLILPIGEWVLREACAQSRRWRDAGLPAVGMSVNVSSAQFREADLLGVVQRALTDANLEATALELELTESMLLHKGDATVKTLEALKAMGIRLAIDDFGTGYSSLSYIKRFPVDTLKIDQSFIREVTSSAEDSALTTSIILMGKSLGLAVVAEGVETRSQLGMLQALGCDEAQGYLFSRPVPPEEAAEILASGFQSSAAA